MLYIGNDLQLDITSQSGVTKPFGVAFNADMLVQALRKGQKNSGYWQVTQPPPAELAPQAAPAPLADEDIDVAPPPSIPFAK